MMMNLDNSERKQLASRVTWVGFYWNVVLTIIKLIAGVIANSAALVADAVHSFSDFASDLAVLAGIKLANKPSDSDHHYGHGKYETFSAVLLTLFLIAAAVGLFINAIYSVLDIRADIIPPLPGWPALFVAFFSILIKEVLYRYTIKAGKLLNSPPIIANAWHHRSDALSSIAAFAGIGGVMLLGREWALLDPVAAIIVSIMIAKVAFSTFRTSIKELLEASLDEEENEKIVGLAASVKGAKTPHALKTRRVGYYFAMDMHIYVDPNLNIVEAHEISTKVEQKIKEAYGDHTLISVHVEPDEST